MRDGGSSWKLKVLLFESIARHIIFVTCYIQTEGGMLYTHLIVNFVLLFFLKGVDIFDGLNLQLGRSPIESFELDCCLNTGISVQYVYVYILAIFIVTSFN